MIHPFAGILQSNNFADLENATEAAQLDRSSEWAGQGAVVLIDRPSANFPSRRAVLGWLSSAAIMSWLSGRTVPAAEKEAKDPPAERALHYVIPKEGKKLSASTVRKLDIASGLSPGWEGRLQYAKTPGYWAWVDDEGAEKIRSDDSVETVEKFNSGDIQEIGAQTTAPTQRLMVHLAPNAWGGKIKRGTFLSAADLAKQWTKNTGDPKVMFRPVGIASVMVLSHGPMPPLALSAIKESPQVVKLQWAGGAIGGGQVTTQALGEEGNVPVQPGQQQGGVTTRALGEEGQGFAR